MLPIEDSWRVGTLGAIVRPMTPGPRREREKDDGKMSGWGRVLGLRPGGGKGGQAGGRCIPSSIFKEEK